MELSGQHKCLIATPISHLPNVHSFVKKNSHYFEVIEAPSRLEVITAINQNKCIKYLFINPNAQGYYIDSEFLESIEILGINTCSTGTNHLDLEACKLKGVEVYSLTKDYRLINDLPSTSELAFGMLISLSRSLILANQLVVDYERWDYTSVIGRQIKGMNVGVLGYGRLGKIFVAMLEGFGVNTLICEADNNKIVPSEYRRVDIKTLFEESDAIAVHIHSTNQNIGIINGSLIRLMKKGSLLINTSRGDICIEDDIAKYLRTGHLGGYGTDVLKSEFSLIQESPIFKLAQEKKYNVIITPHVGGMTYEGQTKAFLFALKKFMLT